MSKRSRIDYEAKSFFDSLGYSSSDDNVSNKSESNEESKKESSDNITENIHKETHDSPEWNTCKKTKKTESPIMILEKMKTRLYNKICAEGGLDQFHLSMKSQDEEYIKHLTVEIENYVDLLSTSMNIIDNQWEKSHIGRQKSCEKYMDHCFKGKGCRKIPGFRIEEDNRGFIAQMYHILQDYGFFSSYLGIDNISSKLPISELDDWFVAFGKTIGKNEVKYGKRPVLMFLDMMLIRVRRVQFLRLFESYCCNSFIQTAGSHIPIDNVLKRIYNAVEKEKKSI